ncbi:hypothetical protein RhiJN_25606 [Ceratobasidium sp. AG-Ba]|nr:hypothetical protein RhiJN_25606 [Ceratobasidium sp. AG-Ba]
MRPFTKTVTHDTTNPVTCCPSTISATTKFYLYFDTSGRLSMTRSTYVGGYELTLEELDAISRKIFGNKIEGIGATEGFAIGTLEIMLNCEIIRCGTSLQGPLTYIVICNWNKNGKDFPFKPTEEDEKLPKFLKDRTGLDFQDHWVAIKNPKMI